MDKLNNWVIEQRDVETGHDFYIPHGDISPIVLSGYGKYYRVTGFWALGKTILWLELWRTNTDGVVVNATLSPNELMGMELGLCDEIELHKLLNNQIVSQGDTTMQAKEQTEHNEELACLVDDIQLKASLLRIAEKALEDIRGLCLSSTYWNNPEYPNCARLLKQHHKIVGDAQVKAAEMRAIEYGDDVEVPVPIGERS